jgi:PAS domain S-box-containing protein
MKQPLQIDDAATEQNPLMDETPEALQARLEKQLALLKDQITQRKATEEALRRESALVKLLQEVAAAANTAETIPSAFQFALDKICAYTNWTIGHMYLLSTDGTKMLSANIYHCADDQAKERFTQASQPLQFTAESGWIGQIFRQGKPLWLNDLKSNSHLGHKTTLLELGVNSGFAFPVLIKTKVVAILEFFSVDLAEPDAELLEAMAYIGTQLGHVVERIHNAQALEQSQALLASAEKMARLGSWEWNIIQNTVTWSTEMYRIYGLDPATFGASHKTYLVLVHPHDRARADHTIQQAILHKRSFSFYHRIIRPDGEVRTILAQGQPILNEAGDVSKMLGTGQDVTEVRQAEARLEYQTQQLTALNKMGQTVTTTLDLERVFARVLAELLPLLKADGIFILLRDGEDLVFVATNETWLHAVKGKRISAARSFAGEVLRTGQAKWLYGAEVGRRMAKEISETAGFQPEVLMVVPLRFHGDLIGVIELIHHKEEGFAEADLRLLEAAAAWTAIAIGNAGLFEAQQQARQTAESLRDANLKLTQTLDLSTIVETLMDHLDQLMGSDKSSVLFPKGDELLIWAARGRWQTHEGSLLEIDRIPPLAEICTQKQTILVADTMTIANWPNTLNQEHQTRSWLGIPLLAGERVLGIYVAGHNQPDMFNERHRLMAEALTGQAAIALQNARLFAELQVNQERLHRLNQKVINAQEEERRRVSRELHDEAGQALTALKITLELMRSDTKNKELAQQLTDAAAMTGKTMEHIRLLAHGLRPPVLDALGLNKALEGLCSDFAHRTHLNVKYNEAELPPLPDPVSISFYRFLQEALTNITKHANAQRVEVILTYADLTQQVCLAVADDGIGITTLESALEWQPGVGLAGMQERFELLGGKLTIESQPGQGTRLMACTTI